MNTLHVEIEATEELRTFLNGQCEAEDAAAVGRYVTRLVEREQIKAALREGLASATAPWDREDLTAIRQRLGLDSTASLP